MKQNEEAIKYIHEAEKLMLENDFYDQAHTYNLFGNILCDSGEYVQAIEYYKKAMKDKQAAQTFHCICPFGIRPCFNEGKEL